VTLSRRPSGWTWVYDPAGALRRSKKPVPADLQHEVERRAQALIDSTLKPRYIQPPPRKTELNYLVDLHARWRGPFFYFCSRYLESTSWSGVARFQGCNSSMRLVGWSAMRERTSRR